MPDEPQNAARGRLSRRQMLATSGVAAGLTWIAPSVLSVNSAAAGSVLATVTVGTAVKVNGNATKDVPLPTGTFTKYLILVAEEFGQSPFQAGPLPSLMTGSFTSVTNTTASPPPSFEVWQSNSASPGTPSFKGNDTNGQWAAVVIGFTTGTTVTATAIATSSASPIAVGSGTAAVRSTWVLLGSANIGALATNWVTPSGYTKLLDTSGTNAAPDLYVARYDTLGFTVPAQSVAFGLSDSARAVQVGVG